MAIDQIELQRKPKHARSTPQNNDVLASLRGDSSRRPLVDPGLAGGLRDWLEDGLCSITLGERKPLVLNKQVLRDVLAGRSRTDAGGTVTAPIALGAVMDALFRQFVTIGRIDDPLVEALDALGLDERRAEIVRFIGALSGNDLGEFRDELETQTAILLSKWPRLSPSWMPRTQERIAVPLAGGDVVLVGVIDLLVGSPSTGRASVGLVEVKSGRARMDDREDLRFYALLETLRNGAPPFRVATFYTRTGALDTEDVDDGLLISSVQRVLYVIDRLARHP